MGPRKTNFQTAGSRTTFQDLPEPILEKILQLVPAVCDKSPQTLFNLACVDQWFAKQLSKPSSDSLWHSAWSAAQCKRPAAAAEAQKAGPALSDLKPRQLLRLAGFTGCMLCGAKAIRKVYWEFSIRCCKECLMENSLAELRIKHDYGLQLEDYQHLPSREVGMYKPRAGAFTFNSYWKPHLLPILQNKHGVQSFKEYTSQKHEEQAQQEAAKKAKRVQRAETLKDWCLECSIDPDQAAKYSETYRTTRYLARPLTRKAFDAMLPSISQEIDTGLRRAAAQKARSDQIPQSPHAPKPGSSTKQGKTASNTQSDWKHMPCALCGGSRLFSSQGLKDHTKTKHGLAAAQKLR